MNTNTTAQTDHDGLLGEVADEYLQQLVQGEKPDIERYAEQHPELASLIRKTFPALQIVNDSLAESKRGEGINLSRSKQLGDFQLLHELGSGGMGFVYEAEQVSMGRHVALKILPMAGALQQRQLLRFRNEVRAAAMLEHPHIVSVYSIGEERGVHFYAMQLIRGQSLAEVIRDLRLVREGDGGLGGDSIHQVISESERRPDGAKGSADQPTEDSARPQLPDPHGTVPNRTLADGLSKPTTDTRPDVKANLSTAPGSNRAQGFFRSAAQLGIQAAEALQHAHDLGVLHRDIKPGNLMLDADTQLHITDFGLARIEADAGVTMTGDILGTLRYMSPEQALAKRVVVDQRSDIYSLGVTLYELLTLQPAFSGNDRQSLLQQIAFEEPERPTQINRAIPRELETIVMKAMAKNPRERYETAQELADDLGRYLDDMPIYAKPPSLLQRTGKWSQRNRTFVRTAVATVAIAAVIGGSLLWRERSRTLAALEQAEQSAAEAETNLRLANEQKAVAQSNLQLANEQTALAETNLKLANEQTEIAEANFRNAKQSVDKYFTLVSENQLLDVPEMVRLREELLAAAIEFYERFVEQRSKDPQLRAELAATHYRIATVQFALGSSKWLLSLRRGVELMEQLLKEGHDVSEFDSWQGSGFIRVRATSPELAAGAWDGLDMKSAFTLFQRSIAVFQRLARDYPTNEGYQNDLGCHFFLGAIARDFLDRDAEAMDMHQQTIGVFEQLIASFPERPHYLFALADSYYELGALEHKHGQLQEAESALRAAVFYCEKLVASNRQASQYRDKLNTYQYSLARKLWADKPEEAEELVRGAIAITEQLVVEYPEKLKGKQRAKLAVAWGELATNLAKTKPLAAVEAFQKAVALIPQVDLDAYDADGYAYLMFLGEVANFLVTSPVPQLRDSEKASEVVQIAISMIDSWEQQAADDPSVAVISHNFALELPASEFLEERTRMVRRSIGFFEAIFSRVPQNQRNQLNLALAYASWADEIGGRTELSEPDAAEAISLFRKSMSLLEEFVEGESQHPNYQNALVSAYNKAVMFFANCSDPQYRDQTEARELANRAIEFAPEKGESWRTLGIAQYRNQDWEAALEALDKSIELGFKSCSNQFFLAMTHWQLGDHDEARRWYDQAVEHRWKQFPDNDDVRRYHTEAASVLGIPFDNEAPTEEQTNDDTPELAERSILGSSDGDQGDAIEPAIRTWTENSDGHRTVEAELVGITDDTATLRRTDGKLFQIQLERLSADDRQYLEAMRPAPAQSGE